MTQPDTDLLAALDALLDEALELSPANRAEWLARVRGERPELADEVERLLHAEAELDANGFLADGIATVAVPQAGLAGRRLGPWAM